MSEQTLVDRMMVSIFYECRGFWQHGIPLPFLDELHIDWRLIQGAYGY